MSPVISVLVNGSSGDCSDDVVFLAEACLKISRAFGGQ